VTSGVLAGYPVVDVKGHATLRFVPRRGLERNGFKMAAIFGASKAAADSDSGADDGC
jgi:hypothetical protein